MDRNVAQNTSWGTSTYENRAVVVTSLLFVCLLFLPPAAKSGDADLSFSTTTMWTNEPQTPKASNLPLVSFVVVFILWNITYLGYFHKMNYCHLSCSLNTSLFECGCSHFLSIQPLPAQLPQCVSLRSRNPHTFFLAPRISHYLIQFEFKGFCELFMWHRCLTFLWTRCILLFVWCRYWTYVNMFGSKTDLWI